MSYNYSTQLYDPVTPQEALSGANIAFRGLRKINTAEQFIGFEILCLLIFRNPRKAMFGPESASRGVTGSYCWIYYMGIGDYSISGIFSLQGWISRRKLFGGANFP